jgi:hypothetical protein
VILTEQQRHDFEMAARPLIKWLNENCHPHVVAIVDPGFAALNEGICGVPVTDYIKD